MRQLSVGFPEPNQQKVASPRQLSSGWLPGGAGYEDLYEGVRKAWQGAGRMCVEVHKGVQGVWQGLGRMGGGAREVQGSSGRVCGYV